MHVINYFKMDLYRCFISLRFVLGVITVLLILLLALQENIVFIEEPDVYSCFIYTMMMMPHMLILSGSSITYTSSLYEDIENKFIQSEIMRGSIKNYIISKVVTIFVSAQITLICGSMMFIILLRLSYPWVIEDSTGVYESILSSGVFLKLLENQNYLLYLFLWCVIYGVLAGILAAISAWMSLYIPSKTLMLIAPVVIFYFLEQSVMRLFPRYMGLEIVFTIDYSWTKNTILAVLLVVSVAIFGIYLCGYMIYKRIEKGGLVSG